jgi:hypothetical protein
VKKPENKSSQTMTKQSERHPNEEANRNRSWEKPSRNHFGKQVAQAFENKEQERRLHGAERWKKASMGEHER